MERDRIVNSRLFRQAAFPFFVRQWPHYERRKDPTASARSGNALLRLRECQKRIWVVASRRCDPNRNISGITRLRFFPFYAGQNADASVILSLPLSLSSLSSFFFSFALFLCFGIGVPLIAICNATRAPLSSHSGASLRDRSPSVRGLMRLVSVA